VLSESIAHCTHTLYSLHCTHYTGVFDSHYNFQELAINHCLHKYGGSTKYMGFYDLDEFIQPKLVVGRSGQTSTVTRMSTPSSGASDASDSTSGPTIVQVHRHSTHSRLLLIVHPTVPTRGRYTGIQFAHTFSP
jgi:hypothetical protein